MSALGKLKAILTGSRRNSPAPTPELYDALNSADVPITAADCRTCPDPCDQDHDDYTRRISVDMDSELLGTVKPYRRQVVISTGKSDWQHEVTEADGTLAAFLSSINENLRTKPDTPDAKSANRSVPGSVKSLPPGVFTQETAGRLSILNGSHNSLTLHHDATSTLDTVIVLPDYKVVSDVPRSLDGAKMLWTTALDPAHGRLGSPERSGTLTSWILPYSCLILLCSHKRRDKRCAVVAPVLEKTFTQCLEHEGWEVHTDLEDFSGRPTLESLNTPGGPDPETAYRSQLRALSGEHRALILRNSHIGGHKFAGNVIIYTPGGSSVWYGRVTPHHVESIVKNTIIGGQVLPPILRGGLNLDRPGCKSLYDW
ncbi:hypothetical protein SCLCIDRAFT_107247 [Scleroderma citrinum Foug A]|uniref:Uncharacterized protein n=1 Tax=Scleroderma citrinum Foug A TaxID=1036808 RepID=A0A0C3EJ07_9AGAM|nr:hypothetical protein SCLCIDRAFT_107247 [Scleroderma citrinum Foug A]